LRGSGQLSDIIISLLQNLALIRRIGLFLFKGWASILLTAGVLSNNLFPHPQPQTILI
jgi:hypothetical protein